MKEFISDCLMTENITPTLLEAAQQKVPETLDFRDLTLKTENQYNEPKCAAFSCTSWLETIMWRKTGLPIDYDPHKLYEWAKDHDGYKNSPGTTLDAVLTGCIELGWIDSKRSDVVCYNNIDMAKKLIHRYGPILGAFNCSEIWMNHYGKYYLDGDPGPSAGGHAVLLAGYDRDGFIIQNSWGLDYGKFGYFKLSWNLVQKQFMYCGIIKNCLNNLG